MDLAVWSESQRWESQPRNQPENVGGSWPCLTITTEVRLSRPPGSVSMYVLAVRSKQTLSDANKGQ